MSVISTITSGTRPDAPSNGSVFYESDTQRLVVYAGDTWHIYNRDSVISPDAGLEELHYDQGIYTNKLADYYIPTSPIMHFDAQYLDGLTNNSDMADQTFVPVWYDRTHAHHAFYSNQGDSWASPRYNTEFKGIAGPGCVVNGASGAVYSNTQNSQGHEGGALNTAPTHLSGDWTVFGVVAQVSTVYAPFGNNSHFMFRSRLSDRESDFLRAGPVYSATNSPNFGEGFFPSLESDSGGPALIICTSSLANNRTYAWRADERGSTTVNGVTSLTHRPIGAFEDADDYEPEAVDSIEIKKALHTWQRAGIYEILYFDKHLPIDEISTVKDYLQTKYQGMDSQFFPDDGPTTALTY